MNEASFASLNPTLLARKGGAKPAMRPQLAPIPDASGNVPEKPANLDDLGWNDMGEAALADGDAATDDGADIVQLKPAIGKGKPKQPANLDEVVEQDNGPSSAKPKRRSAIKRGKRAAFTLRLDPERHLKLRLAATLNATSAQEIVTEALDAMLAEMTEIEDLAAQMKKKKN